MGSTLWQGNFIQVLRQKWMEQACDINTPLMDGKRVKKNPICNMVYETMKWSPTRIETSPSSFSISPSRAESREDFPQPTWPTTASREPCGAIMLILKAHAKRLMFVYSRKNRWEVQTLSTWSLTDILVQNRRILFSPREFPIDNCYWKICWATGHVNSFTGENMLLSDSTKHSS